MRSRLMFALVMLAVPLAVGACSSTPSGALPSRSDAIAYFTSQGFSGAESSAAPASAAPLWVGKGPNDALGEVSGSGNSTDWVSLSVDGQGTGGDLLDAFLKHFAPGSGSFYSKVLNDTNSGGQDQSRTIGGRRVRIQTIGTGNSFLIAMTVSATSAPNSGQ
jgi:hypothetical protein